MTTDSEKKLLLKVRDILNNIDIDTDKIYVSDIRSIIADLEKLEVSLTKESSLVMMGMIAQSLGTD
tara:strand:- start:2785 stop:2982 length:198 start_codon:yes stop_codon:yes gene_type:complete